MSQMLKFPLRLKLLRATRVHAGMKALPLKYWALVILMFVASVTTFVVACP